MTDKSPRARSLSEATSTPVDPAQVENSPTSHIDPSAVTEAPSDPSAADDESEEWAPRGPVKQNATSGTKNTNVRR
ncbi:hypothetical protein DAEQUDRAFT_725920 [Daedalea quercina L-15889]|uniref:Uncharacterized protein n=1 Tax=Daedalea quercina L-15889 TaxID=1314783 RepID=A0A165QUC5_9APHY|nr:hypothetical protein DAEQUDRAFT_725920 [Daedalea quercina L-15889]